MTSDRTPTPDAPKPEQQWHNLPSEVLGSEGGLIGRPQDEKMWDSKRDDLLRARLPIHTTSLRDRVLDLLEDAGDFANQLAHNPMSLALGLFVVLVVAALVVMLPGSSDKSGQPVVTLLTSPTPKARTVEAPAVEPAAAAQVAQPLSQPLPVQVWRSSTLVWPAAGRIAGRFGQGLNGINIETSAAADNVAASSRGTVSSVTLDGCCSTVVLDHEGGLQTVYGNLSNVQVVKGQRLEKGQVVATARAQAGQPARLYFEVRRDGAAVDPLVYLPSTYSDPAAAKAENLSCPTQAIVLDPASSLNLIFTADVVASYVVEAVTVTPADASSPPIQARPRSGAGVTLDVPPPGQLIPQPRSYALDVTFVRGGSRLSSRCSLSFATAAFIPGIAGEQPLPPAAASNGAPAATSTPTRVPPTVTRTPAPSTRTPTSVPVKTATPRQNAPAPTATKPTQLTLPTPTLR